MLWRISEEVEEIMKQNWADLNQMRNKKKRRIIKYTIGILLNLAVIAGCAKIISVAYRIFEETMIPETLTFQPIVALFLVLFPMVIAIWCSCNLIRFARRQLMQAVRYHTTDVRRKSSSG